MSDDEWIDIPASAGPTPGPLPTPTPHPNEDEWVDVDTGYSGFEAVKQFGSGALEATASGLGLLGDVAKYTLFGANVDPRAPEKTEFFPATKKAGEVVQPLLAEKDPQYRYSRRAGEFVGPGVATSLALKGPVAANALVDLFGAVGSRAAEDVTGDSSVAPIVGGLFGSSAASAARNIGGASRDVLRKTGPQQLRAQAKRRLLDETDLSPKSIDDALARMPDDELSAFMTTAEVTGDVGAAQYEKVFSKKGDPSRIYGQRTELREKARRDALDSLADASSMQKEELGEALSKEAVKVKTNLEQQENALWSVFPRDVPIDVSSGQKAVNAIVRQKERGLPLAPKARKLVEQFSQEMPHQAKVKTGLFSPSGRELTKRVTKGEPLTSGQLQDIRSDALALLREPGVKPQDARVLKTLADEIDIAVSGSDSLAGEVWKKARDVTREKKQVFGKAGQGRQTPGYSLTSPDIDVSTAFKKALGGSSKSVRELKAAIGKDPEVLETVKQGLLDRIRLDAKDNLTPSKMKIFIEQHEGALSELFDESQVNTVKRILQDMKSEGAVIDRAFRASRGSSITAQSDTVAGAIHKTAMFPMMFRVSPLAALGSKLGGEVGKSVDAQNLKMVEELLFKAALEPRFAKELLEAPDPDKIRSVMERLVDWAASTGKGGVFGALSTEEDE